MTTTELDRKETISYDKLYGQWERQAWSATAIDFSADAEQWHALSDKERDAMLWNYALFLVGEEAVARDLTPVLDSAEGYPEKVFLATQIVDEARHHVFFDRFLREVAGVGSDSASTLESVRPRLTWGFVKVFDTLDAVTARLRRRPRDRALLAQSVALYHIVVEGMLALAGQHFIQAYLDRRKLLPGFAAGMDNVSRDESRHVAFGVRFLGELAADPECRAAAVELWNEVLPYAVGVFIPPGMDRDYTELFGFTLEDIYAFGLRSFETKLERMGFDPGEIRLLARDDRSLGYEERARRIWVLIEAGVLGDDRVEPRPDERALDVIFASAARSARPEVAREVGTVQWEFTDAAPRYLRAVDGQVEVHAGRAHSPSVTLRCPAGEWAKIAVRRTHPLAAAARGRLRIAGSPRAVARLARLFP